MQAKSRGSQNLAGAARFGYRVPASMAFLRPDVDKARWIEQQPLELPVAGSNPAVERGPRCKTLTCNG